MMNLALSYATLGRHAEAVKLHEQTLALRKTKFGPDHPDVLLSRRHIANSYFALGRYDDALKLREQTLAILRVKLGPDHPDTLRGMADVAESYLRAGRYAEARPLSMKYLESRLKKLPAEIPPSDWQRLRRRGDLYARGSQWQKAVADYAAVIQAHPEDHWSWYVAAPLWLQVGDQKAYRRHCREMLRRFGATADPILAERTAKACLLAPGPADDLAPAFRLADRAVTGTEKHRAYPYFLLVRGLAHYRTGEFDRAIDRLTPCVRLDEWAFAVPAHLIQAMAHQKLGHAEEARKALGKARVLMADSKFPHAEGGDLGDSWHDWLICQHLYREAVALIETAK
jgi:tetratricopeptide (TPR) repeat protein